MKRIFILFGVLALAIGANAQSYQHSNYIGLNINGGFNSMTISPVDMGASKLGLGYGAGLRYTHFFGTHFGIGFGAQFNCANAKAVYNNEEITPNLTHADNPSVTYDLHTVYDNWAERQTLYYLSVPVELYWRAPVNERAFVLIGVGAQYDMPLFGKYKTVGGEFRTEGYFPSLGYTVNNLPDHGFLTYDEEVKGDANITKKGFSVIADLGFNYALSHNWGLYFGIYGGYGLTNLMDSTSTDPLLEVADDNTITYNSTLASDQASSLSLLNFGAKLGINLGWDCEKKAHSSKGGKDDSDAELTSYDDNAPATQQSDDNNGNNNAPANQQGNDNNANNNAPANQQGNDNNGNNNAANYGNNNYGNQAYGNDGVVDETPEEAAAREARCNARRMNNPDMAQAMNTIDADLDEAEQMANAADNAEAKAAVADARAKAADAKAAYKNGKYCRAYDLFNEAYAAIADSYAADADGYAAKSSSDDAKKAAEDAALYAEAAHKDGLDCAMAASRNARINADIAHDQENGGKKANAWNDPNYADYLANEALAMAEDANCKTAKTSAKDASGKAYRGNLADSYAASAKSFAESANKYASRSDNPEARQAGADALRYAGEAAEAARMGDTAAAYRAARAAQEAAERARRAANGEKAAAPADNDNASKLPAADNDNASKRPADRAQLQQYLDQINATVHFDFSSTEPKFDAKTDIAIRALCAAMRADKNVKVLITGHTDNIGTAESNMNYGQRRADALKQLMVNQGAPAAQISTASKGQNEPVVDNDTDEHRYQNRRAVVTLK
jgi:outer membrane protein OmpA-like peptidoglycan-associated protein